MIYLGLCFFLISMGVLITDSNIITQTSFRNEKVYNTQNLNIFNTRSFLSNAFTLSSAYSLAKIIFRNTRH